MPKLFLPASIEHVGAGIEFIETTLEKYKIKRRTILETMLISEEALVRLIDHAPENVNFEISIRRWYNTATITLSVMGKKFQDETLQLDLAMNDVGHDSEESIRSILLQAYANKISYSRKGNYNFVRIHAGAKEPIWIAQTIVSFILAYLVSVILRTYLPDSYSTDLIQYILLPFQNIFLNALQLITAPAIFFSIMTTVSRFTSFSDPGKVTIKIIVGYMITSIIAVLSSLLLFKLIHPFVNSTGMFNIYVQSKTAAGMDNQIYDMIFNIVPNNIVTPFMTTDATQLLLMAIVGGIALGRAGQYSPMLKEIMDALNRFFLECADIISQFIPTAVLFLTLLMILYFKENAIFISVKIFALILIGLAAMSFWYFIMILLLGRLNPIPFFRKCMANISRSFFSESGNNIIDNTLRMCQKKLGISHSVASFSIPFGSIANMDGHCVYLTLAGLSIAQLCDVDILGHRTITILIMVILLSIGASITPASGVLALTMLTGQMYISPMVINILLGLTVLSELFISIFNNVGDVAITLIVARSEGQVNIDTYNK